MHQVERDVADGLISEAQVPIDDVGEESESVEGDATDDGDGCLSIVNTKKLKHLQANEPTLSKIRGQADRDKGDFFWQDGLSPVEPHRKRGSRRYSCKSFCCLFSAGISDEVSTCYSSLGSPGTQEDFESTIVLLSRNIS